MNRRPHPSPNAQVPLSLAVWYQLLAGAEKSGYQKEDWEIAAEAIDEWTRRHHPDGLPVHPAAGYQWKRLFLPSGTLLRTVFAGKNHHAIVEGDQLLYQDKAVSPSGFVNAVGGMRRNAWRCTWLRFPDSSEWKLADALRTRERPRHARRPAAVAMPVATHPPVSAARSAHLPADPYADPPADLPARLKAGLPATEPPSPAVSAAIEAIASTTSQAAVLSQASDERRISADSQVRALLQHALLGLLDHLFPHDRMPITAPNAADG